MTPDQENRSAEITAIAARWAQRCSDGMSPTERTEFKAWIAADARHPRALAEANRAGVDCDWVWQIGAADEIITKLEVRAKCRRRRGAMAGATAAVAFCMAVLVWWANLAVDSTGDLPLNSTLVVVRPNKQALPDGSIVELKDGAQIFIEFRESVRAISLVRGTAYFQVVKDPQRPFVVRAGGLAVQAVGTAFATELAELGKELTVLVTEGRVRVDSSAALAASAASPLAEPLVSIDAGKSVVLPASATTVNAPIVRTVDEAELQEKTAWRIPKLEFSATPLREVIAQMNQHNRRQFVLREDAVGDLRVSGVLRADKMDTLAEMLEADFGVHAERRSEEIILRRSK